MTTFLVWAALSALAFLVGIGLARLFGAKFGSPINYVWTTILFTILGGIAGWAVVPTLHWAFAYVWVSSAIFIALGYLIGRLLKGGKAEGHYDYGPGKLISSLGVLVGLLIIFGVFRFVTTDSFFHHAEYRSLLGEPEQVGTFTDDLAPVDTERLRFVNEAYAQQIADKMLGEQSGLGSRVRVDDMHIAQLNGCVNMRTVADQRTNDVCFEHELVWVAPVVHSGIFRWLNNRETGQYVIVSASDPTRKFLVDQVNGDALHLRYHMHGAHFGDYLVRHLRENGYMSRGLTDFNFELDDSGVAWWVAVTFENRVGFAGYDPTGVVVVNPTTGEIQEYGLDEIPAWVDRVQPEHLVIEQIDNWGRYIDGWVNSILAKTGVVQTSTYDLHLVEGTDGRTYWYTGITSVGSDESTTGFVLVDTRTKEVRLYTVPGATEAAAQNSAMNAPGARERQYTAGEPILYNMGGHPTYFMTLSGDDNVPRMYAFVSVRDFEIVGAAESIADALSRYEARIRATGRADIDQRVLPSLQLAGVVQRIVRDSEGWSVLLEDEAAAEFYIPGSVSPETKYTQPGDAVEITYQVIPDRLSRIVSAYDNTDLQLTQ